MRRTLVALAAGALLVLCLGCALAACGGSQSPAPLASKAGIDDTGAGPSGMGISISAPGQVYLVESDDPASGRHWSLKLPAGVKLLSSRYHDHTRTLTFSVPQPGMYMVKGAYARPGQARPAKTFTLRIYGNPAAWPAPSMVFTSGRNGLGTDAGGIFAIALKENASTGYGWVMHFGPGLKVLHQMSVTPAATAPLVGAGGQHLWLFQVARKTGTTSVTGSSIRPWAPAAPAARFALKVTLSPPGS